MAAQIGTTTNPCIFTPFQPQETKCKTMRKKTACIGQGPDQSTGTDYDPIKKEDQ